MINSKSLSNARILITGGTGSFGEAFIKSVKNRTDIESITLFSRDEKKQWDLRNTYSDLDFVSYIIGDVRDYRSVTAAMRGITHVFHAAALKQVPSCEFFPEQAVKTNILGAQNLLTCFARESVEVQKAVFLSTDKAVYPINAMGLTKALMEKSVFAYAREQLGKTDVSVTRYGNVLSSRGSVIPRFVAQIKAGKELTITHPDMSRFLMTLSDAIDLVIYAMANEGGGNLLIKKSPSALLPQVAEAARLFCGCPSHPEKIVGIRHGEKLHETLISAEEMAGAIDEGAYFRVPLDSRDRNYESYFDRGVEQVVGDQYSSNSQEYLTADQILDLIRLASSNNIDDLEY